MVTRDRGVAGVLNDDDIGAACAAHAGTAQFARAVETAHTMIVEHLDIAQGHVAWSGGKDSTVLAHLAHSARPGTPIVTYVAGIEYPEVVPFCEGFAALSGWAWEPIQTGDVAAAIRASADLIGSAEYHDIMIAGPASEAHRRHGRGLLWGLRADESHMRTVMLRSTRGVRERNDGVRTCAPLWRWTELDVRSYHAAHGLPFCATYDVMRRLGMPMQDRRVGRMLGRNAVTGEAALRRRALELKTGWPTAWLRLCEDIPWLARY